MQLTIRRFELSRVREDERAPLFLALLAALAVTVAFLGLVDRPGMLEAPTTVESGP